MALNVFRNHLIASLDGLTLAGVLPHLHEIELAAGTVIGEPGEMPSAVYFPSSAVISVVTLLEDGRSFEVSSIGYEGAAHVFPCLTGVPQQTRTFTQVPGRCLRLPIGILRKAVETHPILAARLLVYLQISAGQSERTIACNAVHPLASRLARWLLITNDRVGSPAMKLTQDYMCVMAGALRSSISMAASSFKRDGLITYSRGKLRIIDRSGLERRACDCYRSDLADLDVLLDGQADAREEWNAAGVAVGNPGS